MTPAARTIFDRIFGENVVSLAFLNSVHAPVGGRPTDPKTVVGYRIAMVSPEKVTLYVRLSSHDPEVLARYGWGATDDGYRAGGAFLPKLLNVVAGQYMAEAHPHKIACFGFPEPITSWPDGPVVGYDIEGCRVEVLVD